MAESYFDVLTAAINDLAEHGYDSPERVTRWSTRLRDALKGTMTSEAKLEVDLRIAMTAAYRRLVDQGELAKFHQGVGRFAVEKVRPALRAELDRRILAAANLIKLNREEAVRKTLRRFEGWSTSIPRGGSDHVDRREEKADLRKALKSLPFEERRVLIDQGHKLRASLSDIVARDGGAIAAVWRSHWRQAGYDYREDHKDRDAQVYLLKSSWARDKGLVKPGPAGLFEDITAPGEEPFCRCYVTWVYHLRDLLKDMLTERGAEELERVREQIRRMA